MRKPGSVSHENSQCSHLYCRSFRRTRGIRYLRNVSYPDVMLKGGGDCWATASEPLQPGQTGRLKPSTELGLPPAFSLLLSLTELSTELNARPERTRRRAGNCWTRRSWAVGRPRLIRTEDSSRSLAGMTQKRSCSAVFGLHASTTRAHAQSSPLER